MTRLITDGAEYGDTRWFNYQTGVSVSSSIKRSGNYSYLFGATGPKKYLGEYETLFDSNTREFYLRCGLYTTNNNTSGGRILWFSNGGTQWGALGIFNGFLRAFSGGTAVGTGTIPITTSTWHLIEIYFLGQNSGGRIVFKVNGVIDIDFTGDTQPTAISAGVDVDYFVFQSVTGSTYIDDIAVNSSAGAEDNSWIGDGHVIALKPNANGDSSELVGSDGNSTDNYVITGDLSDTTYVRTTISGAKDLYHIEPFTESNVNIKRIWAMGHSHRSIASSKTASIGIKPDGGSEVYADSEVLASPTLITTVEYTTNPVTGLPWTSSDLENLQLVLKGN